MKPTAQALTQVSLSQKGEQKEKTWRLPRILDIQRYQQGRKYVLGLNATAADEQSTSEALPSNRGKKSSKSVIAAVGLPRKQS